MATDFDQKLTPTVEQLELGAVEDAGFRGLLDEEEALFARCRQLHPLEVVLAAGEGATLLEALARVLAMTQTRKYGFVHPCLPHEIILGRLFNSGWDRLADWKLNRNRGVKMFCHG